MGKHEGESKKYKEFVAEKPDRGDRLEGGDGKHNGGKSGNEDNGNNGDKK
ncbi:hypothetical protein [Nonomuraea aurantiaca]|jgi:hypothetical protein|nr:hypothetical protein [Nonomuraea aurantiaca]MCA2220581.1 hypothetical protein [Nonomuraea aurantiaca]